MKNTYKIIWSDEALNGLTNIIRYIENKFSEKDVKKFAVLFDKQIKVIQSFPESFPLSKKSKNIRKSVVAKLTSIYYSFDGIHPTNPILLTISDYHIFVENLRL